MICKQDMGIRTEVGRAKSFTYVTYYYMLSPCNISYSFSEDVAYSNETLELHYKPLICLFCMFFAWLYYFFFVYNSTGTSVIRILKKCNG